MDMEYGVVLLRQVKTMPPRASAPRGKKAAATTAAAAHEEGTGAAAAESGGVEELQAPAPAPARQQRKRTVTRKRASSSSTGAGAPVDEISAMSAATIDMTAASLNALQMDDDTVILKLDICGPSSTPLRVPANAAVVDEFQPDPYNSTILNRHTAFESHPAIASPLPVIITPPAPKDTRIVRLLSDFQEKSKVGEWPSSTQVHCYWCCHSFSTPPLGLPIRYLNGRFHVIGCFCSLECASAYNFDHMGRDSVDDCLMRHSLLNALSIKLGLSPIVRQAPDRLALQIFGGHMSIDEFRAHGASVHGSTSRLIVNTPPMHCVTQHIEEISDHDLQSEYRYVPLDTDRISRYQEKVRLSRTKPLSNFKNTLDHTMNIKISSSSSAAAASASASALTEK